MILLSMVKRWALRRGLEPAPARPPLGTEGGWGGEGGPGAPPPLEDLPGRAARFDPPGCPELVRCPFALPPPAGAGGGGHREPPFGTGRAQPVHQRPLARP